MCGIVGIVHLDERPVEAAVLAHMGEALRHRGPDDEGCYAEAAVGFYHTRLSIIDLSGGHQPMSFGPHTVAFNGEIYNYVELREELKRRGHVFRTTSDTEVILKMYAEHGPGCVAALNGMFAFLLHDRARGQVVAARDHFGIKPLYYTVRDGAVLFASEIKALLRHPLVRAEVDYDALSDYLTFQFVLGDATLFRGINKLPAGHTLTIDLASRQVRTERYWEPRFAIDSGRSEESFVEELRWLLDDSVRLQLRSDVPVGAYLSGGLDSSIVTLLAAARYGGGKRMKTFTAAFREGPEFDETFYAREVARAAGSEAFEFFPTERDFTDLLPQLVRSMDEPAAGPGLFPQFIVARAASREVKVVLGGQGGDEVFGGYVRYLVAYLEQALKGAILETNEEAEHIVSLASIVPNLPALRAYVPMLQEFWSQEAFEPMDRRYFRLLDRSGKSLAAFSREFRASHRRDEVFGRFQRVFNHPDTLSYYNKMTHFDMVTGLPALLHVEDRVSMANSLESRVPLLDYRIADLVTRMPPRMKFKGGALKYILKKAVGDLVPVTVLARKDKMGFPVPLHHWVNGPCRAFVEDVLLSPRARERELYDTKAVRKLVRAERAFGRGLWGLLNLELWFREYIDPAAPRRVRERSVAFQESL